MRKKQIARWARVIDLLFTIAVIFAVAGCKFWFSNSADANSGKKAGALYVEGQTIYTQRCLACHNQNPRRAGAVGPAIYSSSMALLKARVLFAKYPAGYKPKRATHIMPQMPDLKPELPAIYAFLNGKQ